MGTQQIRETVERYVELVGTGTAAEIAQLYAPDATVEDPVGSPVRQGHDAIVEFYGIIEAPGPQDRTADHAGRRKPMPWWHSP
jgi:steroid delta-isomerase